MADVDNTQDDKANFEQVQALIKEQVRQHYTEFEAERQRAQQPAQDQQAAARQQLREVIDPIYGGDIANARFDAADAKDYASFYRNNPDAMDYEQEIEKQFQTMKANGRPTTRQDIADWRDGNERRTAPEKWTARQAAREKAQLERAQGAVDMGSYGGKVKDDDMAKFTDFEHKSLEDQEAALEGMTF